MNAIFQSNFGSKNLAYKVGLSYYADNYKENLNEIEFVRNDRTTGAFSELTLNRGEKFTSIVGRLGLF